MRAIRRHNAHNSSRRRTRSLVNQLTWLRRTRQHCRYFRVCASHRNRRCSTIEVKLVRIRGRHNPKIFTSLLPAPTSQHLHRLPRQQVCHVFVRMARLSARSVALQGIKMAHDYSTAVARAERERGPQNPNEGAQPVRLVTHTGHTCPARASATPHLGRRHRRGRRRGWLRLLRRVNVRGHCGGRRDAGRRRAASCHTSICDFQICSVW